MPTPPKSFKILQAEKKSHRTKKELALREQGEKSLLSGIAMKESPEVKANELAHKHFRQMKKLMKTLEKDDAVYEQTINRYCLVMAEASELLNEIELAKQDIDNFRGRELEMDAKTYYATFIALQKRCDKLEVRLNAKRTMLNALEKENGLTISSALRIIPKKPEQSPTSALKQALSGL